jgi:hypothetical protein
MDNTRAFIPIASPDQDSTTERSAFAPNAALTPNERTSKISPSFMSRCAIRSTSSP